MGGELRSLKPAAGGEQSGEAPQLIQNKEATETNSQPSKEQHNSKTAQITQPTSKYNRESPTIRKATRPVRRCQHSHDPSLMPDS